MSKLLFARSVFDYLYAPLFLAKPLKSNATQKNLTFVFSTPHSNTQSIEPSQQGGLDGTEA